MATMTDDELRRVVAETIDEVDNENAAKHKWRDRIAYGALAVLVVAAIGFSAYLFNRTNNQLDETRQHQADLIQAIYDLRADAAPFRTSAEIDANIADWESKGLILRPETKALYRNCKTPEHCVGLELAAQHGLNTITINEGWVDQDDLGSRKAFTNCRSNWMTDPELYIYTSTYFAPEMCAAVFQVDLERAVDW